MLPKVTKRRFVDYILEFIIVLLGITIAFWLSNLGEKRTENRLEQLYLQQLMEDLTMDINGFKRGIVYNDNKIEDLSKGIGYLQSQPRRMASADTIAKYALRVGNYNFFYPTNNSYLTLQQSGDLKIIKDQELKKKLISLYQSYMLIKNEQDNLIQALDDNFFPTLYESYDMILDQVTDPAYFRSTKCTNFIGFAVNQTNQLNNLYHSSSRLAKETADLIELEMGGSQSSENDPN